MSHWSNTLRGAQFLDGTVPRLIRAIEELTKTLKESQMKEDEDEITRRVLHAALDACGGRSIDIAEMIDDLERKSKSVARIQKVLDLSTSHVPGPDPDWGNLRAVGHEHGWIVFINPNLDGIPLWWRHIGEMAEAHGCLMVNFDSAADTVDCFETWEW
jgi:hypothetical protein